MRLRAIKLHYKNLNKNLHTFFITFQWITVVILKDFINGLITLFSGQIIYGSKQTRGEIYRCL